MGRGRGTVGWREGWGRGRIRVEEEYRLGLGGEWIGVYGHVSALFFDKGRAKPPPLVIRALWFLNFFYGPLTFSPACNTSLTVVIPV